MGGALPVSAYSMADRLIGVLLALIGVGFLILKLEVLGASNVELALSLTLIAIGVFMAIARPQPPPA